MRAFLSSLRSLFPRMASSSSEVDRLSSALHFQQPTSVLTLFETLRAHPEDYAHILLENIALCATDSGPRHDLLVIELYRLLEDGTRRYYFVAADRVPVPQHLEETSADSDSEQPVDNAGPNATDDPPNSSRSRGSNPSKSTNGSKIGGQADDCARQWRSDPDNPRWWRGACCSSSRPATSLRHLFDFDPARSGMTRPLTFIDVVLALESVSQTAPIYSLRKHNCWWYARCVLLVLVLRQQEVLSSPTPRPQTEQVFFRKVETTTIPYPDSLTKRVMTVDTASAEIIFRKLVRPVSFLFFSFNQILSRPI